MQLVRDIYATAAEAKRPVVSLEFFPPKTAEGDRNLFEKTLPALSSLRPDYCSVTYGAGGSTRDKTLQLVDRIQREHQLTAVAHLTCVESSREQVGELLSQIKALGVKNLLALRGDPPGGGPFRVAPGGFEFASQLVRYIREQNGFSVGVAGFPEGHIACTRGKHADWDYLKQKVDAGADFILTQLFFDNKDFFEFRDYLVNKLKVTIPIIPGMVSILSGTQIKKFTALCGARIPAQLEAKLNELGENDEAVGNYGVDYATAQCAELLKQGVPGIHFYTLNKAHSTTRILRNLGLAPQQ